MNQKIVTRGSIGLLAIFSLLSPAVVTGYDEPLLIEAKASLGQDSNAGNTGLSADAVSDQFGELELRANRLFTPGTHTSAELETSIRKTLWRDLEKLSNTGVELLARLNHRPGGRFHTPTLSAWSAVAYRDYRSDIRDGKQYRIGISALQPLTTRINARAGLRRLWRRADNDVFAYQATTLDLDLDWQISPDVTTWLGISRRRGDMVSSSRDYSRLRNASSAWMTDDAFVQLPAPWLAYRLDARADALAVGVDYALGPAIQLGARLERSDARAGYNTRYRKTVAMLSLHYRMGFGN